jgi:hypothetical protein
LLHYLHGLANEPFDLSRRADFLRFVDDDPQERAAALDQFRARIPARQIDE